MEFTKTCSRSKIKNRIVKNGLLPYKCAICNIDSWNNKPISLHLDHINGINNDNRLDNLRFLCPNCHSQTESYCGKNNTSYSVHNKKVDDDTLLDAMRTSSTPMHALKKCGLVGAGNYTRVYRLAELHDIENMKKGYKKEYKIVECSSEGCNNTFRKSKASSTYCSHDCRIKNLSRKSDLSSEEILEILKSNLFNFSKTSREIGISDNAIRKRVKHLI